MKERKLTVSDYGICLYSVSQLKLFLKKKGKARTKKLLPLFQKDKNFYLDSLRDQAWLPIVRIDSEKYLIKIKNSFDFFDDEWEKVFSYDCFSISIGEDNAVWIATLGELWNFSEKKYIDCENDTISYQTLDGIMLNSAFRYELNKGNYLVKIEGYKRIVSKPYPEANAGFLFTFKKVDEFEQINDPREDKYYFNSVNR